MLPYGLTPQSPLREINLVLQLLADDARRGVRSVAAPPPAVSLKPVEEAFAKAKLAGVRYPALRLGAYEFSPAGETSRNPGGIYVKTLKESGGLPGVYLGKVINGAFMRSRDCTPAQQDEIVAISRDPKAAALAFGKRFGRCSVCNRPLTDPASVERSIGPVCAAKYGF